MSESVLIVDDSPTMRKMVRFSIKAMKRFEKFVEANDGLEAIDQLTKNKIDLIICDINMPNMNGFDFLRKVKTIENFRNIPVIMLSTESSLDDMKQALKLGANQYVKKPFNPLLLKKAIDKILA